MFFDGSFKKIPELVKLLNIFKEASIKLKSLTAITRINTKKTKRDIIAKSSLCSLIIFLLLNKLKIKKKFNIEIKNAIIKQNSWLVVLII